MKSISHKNLLFILLAAIYTNSSLAAWEELSSDYDLRCKQTDSETLNCDYRLMFPGKADTIRATAAGIELPVSRDNSSSDNTTAIYFLIDTSDPGRAQVIKKNIGQIERLLTASGPHHKIGLATFDKKLHILAPVGSSKSRIITAAKEIEAKGRTTELYRNLLLTIEKLSRVMAHRKAIYLFSDGQAEDQAYFHADVVKAARSKGVIINSIGFPRSISLSVALQTLRRLSEETGGEFIESDKSFNLDDKFYRQPYQHIDRGEKFHVDLTPLTGVFRTERNRINLKLETDIGLLSMDVPVVLQVTARPIQESVSPVVNSPVQPEIKIIRQTAQAEEMNVWLWYGLPIALIILFLLALITLIMMYRKQPEKTQFAVSQQNKPFAYLVTQDEKSRRYPILNTTWRIGRSKDNELPLPDNSVSRRHAEIHRYNNGNFIITDIESLNGIYVNDEQVSKKKLQEGDIIEIGDIYLRFTHHPEDYLSEDDTAIQKTKVPAH